MRSVIVMLVMGMLVVGGSGCSGGQPATTPSPTAGHTSAGTAPAVPAGYALRTGDGFQVAVPEKWSDIPASTRSYPDAAMEVGVPFTGQPTLQPRLVVWVDRGDNLGSATSQAELAQVKVRADISGAKVGELKDAQVAGALSAVWFEYSYHMDAATSVLDTPIEASDYRIRDLTVQVDGKPQFGFRYSAAAADFRDEVWTAMVASIVVRADQ
jgi:hypothetical protein